MEAVLTGRQTARITEQLERLRASPVFSASKRLHSFLAYIVRAELDGEGSELNQVRIGLDVFERDGQFDPSIDSIVRVEAGRLRSKLSDYYNGEGTDDPVVISLPKGRYNPTFAFREASAPGENARSRLRQDIRFCQTADGVSVAYAELGAGMPLVKVANWLSHLEFDLESPVWRHWWRDLSERFRLVRYDERGCGLSDWDTDDFSLEVWTRDLEEVVERVGLKRFPLLGISQGASVAINYAVLHPDRISHLVLYGGFIQGRLKRNPTDQQREEAKLLTELARVGWGGSNAAFRKTFATLFVPDANEEQFRAFDELQQVSTSARNAACFLDAFNNLDAVELAPLVQAKTLVIHSRNEAEIPLSQAHLIAKLIPNAKLVTLESGNHILGETEPAWSVFLTEVDRFLQS